MHTSTSGYGISHDGTTDQQTGGHTLILIIQISPALDLRLFPKFRLTSDLRETIEFLSNQRYQLGGAAVELDIALSAGWQRC